MGLEGRVVIITGAAGGLGRVVAREFARGGARLALVGKRLEPLKELAAGLRLPSEQALTHSVNLVDPEAAYGLVQAVMGKFGRVDVLLHLVGGWSGGKTVENVSDLEVDAMLQQHLWTSLHLVKAVVPHMRSGKWGRILAVSSPTASQPAAERAPYAIGKAAQEALMLTLAQELKGSGVTANLVLVSTIDVAGERQARAELPPTRAGPRRRRSRPRCCTCAPMRPPSINGARIPLYGG